MPSLETNVPNVCGGGDLRPSSRQSITSTSRSNHGATDNTYTRVGETDNRYQFQYPNNQSSSHASLNHWKGNPGNGYQISNYSSHNTPTTSSDGNKTRSHLRYFYHNQPQRIQPSLINLDRTDLSIPLFQYPLLSGVTMLGTGKGTVKPPDIVLHGSQVAPQHAFIERLGDEVTLHPISDNTSVNGRRVNGPTPLQPGNLISIGESYFFRYDGPPPAEEYLSCQSPYNNRFYIDESPYAVINPRSGNPSRSAGDVNKNPFLTTSATTIMDDTTSMEESTSASSITLESRVCPTSTADSFQSPRSSSASTSNSDPEQTSSICTEDSCSQKYRDGLESENFVNKIARFEFLTHNQPPPPFPTVHDMYGSNCVSGTSASANNGNGMEPIPKVQVDYPGSRRLNYYNEPMLGSDSGYSNNNNDRNNTHSKGEGLNNGYGGRLENNKPGVLSRPNVNFNRSDQGFGSMFYTSSSSNNNHLQDDSSFSSSSVSPPDRIPSSTSNSYRRTGGVTFYEDGNATTPSPASLFLTDFEHDEESSSFVNHSSSSMPSPDSLSSISNHHLQSNINSKSQHHHHYHHNGERVPSRNSNSSNSSIMQHNNNLHHNHHHLNNNSQHSSSNNENQASIACETLLQIKRKQAKEARLVAEVTQNEDKLKLDEILAMCAEYEEQIAKEIIERRSTTTTSASKLSVSTPYSSVLSLKSVDQHNASGANCNGQAVQCSSRMSSVSGGGSVGSEEGNQSQTSKSPTTPLGPYNYNRIKTNGSLPRDASKKKASTLPTGHVPDSSNPSPQLHSHSKMDEEIASIFTFSISDSKRSSSLSSSCNGSNSISFNGTSDEVFSPKSPLGANKHDLNGPSQTDSIVGFRSTTSPYENVVAYDGKLSSSEQSPHYSQPQNHPRLGLSAASMSGPPNGRGLPETNNCYPRRPILSNIVERKNSIELPSFPVTNSLTVSQSPVLSEPQQPNNATRHTHNQNGYSFANSSKSSTSSINNGNNNISSHQDKIERSDTPPKSKLSVSFANSVKEFGKEDEDNEEEKPKPVAQNAILFKGIYPVNGNTKEANRPIVKTIATEVQVHTTEDCNNIKNRITEVNSGCSSEHAIDTGDVPNPKIRSPPPPSICISNCLDEDKESSCGGTTSTRNDCSPSSLSSFSTNASQNPDQTGAASSENTSLFPHDEMDAQSVNNLVNTSQNRKNTAEIPFGKNPVAMLKKEIREIEEQEMEAIREMEIEKALLLGEEKSLENQLASEKEELAELKDRLSQIDESNRRWKADGLERISELKTKLMYTEKELQRLERMHEEFCGSTDEETVLLERLKFQHELVESDRKSFEDAEFHQMEEEINKETHRDELSKLIAERSRRVLSRQFQLEKVRSQNTVAFGPSTKEIQSLECRRQEFIKQLRKVRDESKRAGDILCLPDTEGMESLSDCDDTMNSDLEEKLKSLSIPTSPSGADDALHIERIKSRSPIDPHMGGTIGPKTCETLREIERNREFLLNEQGVQMLEEERARVRELQKRVQDAVREEWEASRKSRSNQCQSLNSVGSEDSGHTVSDTPTDSGSGDDTTDKSAAPSISTTDVSLADGNGSANGLGGQNSFELCQQMRQKQREMSKSYEETRPLSDDSGSAYDENGSAIVTMRDKHRIQNRPLTRYLPVREDEEEFDLRTFIEQSHQLELCPHVIVTNTAARGFLSKLGSRFNNWNKRWFVFDRETKTFSYYADKNERKSKARGGVHFDAIQEVYVDHLQSVKSPVPRLTFCVKTYNRVFYLLAPSAEAMRMWMDIIFTGAGGYKEFKCGS